MNKTLEKIKSLARSTMNPPLVDAKKNGRRIMGYFCSYIPEEIIHAAGFIPYRIRAVGSENTIRGDKYFSPLNCTFVRHCFDKVLHDDYAFLDGVVFLNGCDHTRRMYDNWRDVRQELAIGPEFLYMFVAPHVLTQNSLQQYNKELDKFKKTLESTFQITVEEKNLTASIKLYNYKRILLKKLDQKRSRHPVAITGSELLNVMLAITAIPIEDAIALLETLDQLTEDRSVSQQGEVRLMLMGGCQEDLDHIDMIEKMGALFVADNLCLGARHFHSEVDETEAPLEALAKRYLYHLSCPRMINGFSQRMEFITKTLDDYNIEAVIAEKLKFCDLWGGEIFLLKKELKKNNIPILAMERELFGGTSGQIKTRVQAFIEQVRGKRE
ncbi:2-hydroxyacyl-CoA dehydratase subunit D [candidate division CSSED10-310 bacterium]|uniref:2-hydroxyacyl-CoA dehydratase subunit D n=1 Tax=candidate division CSSED10-310 bacterium TaxID=2855610 RepID=A0ABV6Z038_UNCC1